MPTAGGSHQDIRQAAQINQDQFVVARDGSFRIRSAPRRTAPPVRQTISRSRASGYCIVGVRDILSDWSQRACRLTIRRLDRIDAPAVRHRAGAPPAVHRDLAGYIRFWAHFPDIWFGGLKPNTHSPPLARPGGWGFVSGLNYRLATDEALVVTTDPGGAKYTGFQINDPWMIAPDARLRQVCLNGSQTTPNADGTVTYIIAASDPGAANWLDTAGYRDGLAIIRWQAIPPDLKGDGLIREFRVAKLAEVAAMKDLPRVTPAQRRRGWRRARQPMRRGCGKSPLGIHRLATGKLTVEGWAWSLIRVICRGLGIVAARPFAVVGSGKGELDAVALGEDIGSRQHIELQPHRLARLQRLDILGESAVPGEAGHGPGCGVQLAQAGLEPAFGDHLDRAVGRNILEQQEQVGVGRIGGDPDVGDAVAGHFERARTAALPASDRPLPGRWHGWTVDPDPPSGQVTCNRPGSFAVSAGPVAAPCLSPAGVRANGVCCACGSGHGRRRTPLARAGHEIMDRIGSPSMPVSIS